MQHMEQDLWTTALVDVNIHQVLFALLYQQVSYDKLETLVDVSSVVLPSYFYSQKIGSACKLNGITVRNTLG